MTPSEIGGGYGPGGTWRLVELVAVIAGPLFLLCLLLLVSAFIYHYHRRGYNHRQRLEVEDPSCDHLYLAKDRSLEDLLCNLSTSGSGSGQYSLVVELQPDSHVVDLHQLVSSNLFLLSFFFSGQVSLSLSSGL